MNLYSTICDQDLFDLVKLEDEAAFKEIYERYFAVLYVHAYKMLRDKEEAQDIVQEVFTTLWSKRDSLLLTSSLPAYFYTAVRNKIFNIFSHKHVESAYIQSLKCFVDQGICQTDYLLRENELVAKIEKEVANLPPRMQEIFQLSRTNYLSHKEIASELNLSEQTVKKQVNYALRILRAKLGPLFFFIFLFF